MHQTPHDAYLEAAVRTATPQRLRLMLIDGALRFARKSLQHWTSDQQPAESYESLVRCRRVVTELCGSIKVDNPAARDVKELYLFLFRQLAEAPTHNDRQRVENVVEVLEQERETWRQVCEKMPEVLHPANAALQGCQEVTAEGLGALNPAAPAVQSDASSPIDRLSLEA